MIRLDDDTFVKNNLSRARILINTSMPKLNSALDILVNGKPYHINIFEELECPAFEAFRSSEARFQLIGKGDPIPAGKEN